MFNRPINTFSGRDLSALTVTPGGIQFTLRTRTFYSIIRAPPGNPFSTDGWRRRVGTTGTRTLSIYHGPPTRSVISSEFCFVCATRMLRSRKDDAAANNISSSVLLQGNLPTGMSPALNELPIITFSTCRVVHVVVLSFGGSGDTWTFYFWK